jgi:2-iminobutanoate/2-iminopropanoate deaminase
MAEHQPTSSLVVARAGAVAPTTTSARGRLLVVGGQVPRDEAANVVGKGDMRAQIEQVGKNVGACLKAGGATVNDRIFTVSSVTAPADFEKYADLLPR